MDVVNVALLLELDKSMGMIDTLGMIFVVLVIVHISLSRSWSSFKNAYSIRVPISFAFMGKDLLCAW